jgi:hypothetical protein
MPRLAGPTGGTRPTSAAMPQGHHLVRRAGKRAAQPGLRTSARVLGDWQTPWNGSASLNWRLPVASGIWTLVTLVTGALHQDDELLGTSLWPSEGHQEPSASAIVWPAPMTWDPLPPEADTPAATNEPAEPATPIVVGSCNVHIPPVLRTSWVTDTVAVPPETNKLPGCCAPRASWAAVHRLLAAVAGVVTGGELTAGVVARAPAGGDWLGGTVAVAAEVAEALVATDGATVLPWGLPAEFEQPTRSVASTHATAPATLAAHDLPRICSPLALLRA